MKNIRLITLAIMFVVTCCVACKEEYPESLPVHISKKYVIGNYYNKNGIQGIVYRLDEGDTSGMIVSLDEREYCQWSDSLNSNFKTEATDPYDGTKNMKKIKDLGFDNYPAFKWCDEKNFGNISGWYLPSLHELDEIGRIYSQLNDTLITIDGGMVLKEMYYWSSTDVDATKAVIIVFIPNHPGISPASLPTVKTARCRVRAVHNF